MSYLAWTAAAFRVLAVWLACGLLVGVPGTLGGAFSMSQMEPMQPVSAILLPAVIVWITSGLVVAGLWQWSDRLAQLVWRHQAAPAAPHVESRDLQQVVLAVFGVYLVVIGLPHLTELAGGYYSQQTAFGVDRGYIGEMWARALGVAAQIAVGLWMTLQSGAMARWLSRPSSTVDDDDTYEDDEADA